MAYLSVPKIALAVLFIMRTSDSLTDQCHSPLVSHRSKNGYSRCCEAVDCAKGQHAEICPSDGRRASCEECSPDYYMDRAASSRLMESCKQKLTCKSRGMIVEDDGDLTTDRKCACDLSRSYFDPYNCTVGDCPEVCKRKNCPAGQESDKSGSCVPCTMGHFKAESGFDRCVMKTHCTNQKMKFKDHGNFTHDSVCVNHTTTEDHTHDPPSAASHTNTVSSPVLATIIIVSIVFVSIVVLGFVAVYCRKRRKRTNSLSSSEDMIPDDKYSDVKHMQEHDNLSSHSIVAPDPPPMHHDRERSPLMDDAVDHNTHRKQFFASGPEDSGLFVDGEDDEIQTQVKSPQPGVNLAPLHRLDSQLTHQPAPSSLSQPGAPSSSIARPTNPQLPTTDNQGTVINNVINISGDNPTIHIGNNLHPQEVDHFQTLPQYDVVETGEELV